MDRRSWLSVLSGSVAAVAGCSGFQRSDAEETTAPDTHHQPSESTDASATPTTTPTQPAERTGSTQYQYDAENTGTSQGSVPETIHQRWRSGSFTVGLAVADNTIFIPTRGTLTALHTDDGSERWSIDVANSPGGTPAVDGPTVYMTIYKGRFDDRGVVAVDLTDGSERWRAIPEVDVMTAPTVARDTVYVGGSLSSKQVTAIDATDGEVLWRVPVGQYASTPAVSDGIVYVGGGETPAVYALGAATGEQLWRAETDGSVWAAPAVADGTVYVGTHTGTLYALDASTGEERWHIGGYTRIHRSVATTGEAVYVPGWGSIDALASDGTELWTITARENVFAPSIAGDSVIVADDQEVFCVDAADGTERWRKGVRSERSGDTRLTGIGSEPVVANGDVYVMSSAGEVYAFGRAAYP